MPGALSSFRICDFTGQLAGAGATKWLASFGAEVIRIEDPVRQGRWDILRGVPPYVDDRRGIDLGGGFNNHNTDKLGITLNLRTERGKELLTRLIELSDVVSENFAKGVLERWGFGYERLREIKPDIVYVSNCGFGHVGPYSDFKSWGPIAQAVSGLTFASGLPGKPPAGWGYSYMDHTGAYYMAMAIMLALLHRQRTGEGQWVDLACTDAAVTLNGPALLDWTVNGRPTRREGSPDSNRNAWPPMAPHGIYPSRGDDEWVAISCRNQGDWEALAGVVAAEWCSAPRLRAARGTPRGAGRTGCPTRGVDVRALEVRHGSAAGRRGRAGGPGPEARGTHRSGPEHRRLRTVADSASHGDGRCPGRRSGRALLEDGLEDRARRALPRRTHRRSTRARARAR